MTQHHVDDYERRFSALADVANRLETYLTDTLRQLKRVDRVSARAKSPSSYIDKASKKDEEGKLKYTDPRNQIMDQIGARVTVFYIKDVSNVRREIDKYFRSIESEHKAPSLDSEFGYFGVHMILKTPEDVVPDEYIDSVPEFFELQIKTLFQHAWSEAHHDLGYKSLRALTSDERRKIAFTAAQAWGADTMFDELAVSLTTDGGTPQ